MRLRLFYFVAFLAFTLSAHADLYPGNYNVSINGANSGTNGFANGFANISGVGVVPFSAGLTPDSVNFSFGTQVYGPNTPSLNVNTVQFTGNRVADIITAITLEPSSTIAGIVATTYTTPGLPGAYYPYTYILFDFSKAIYQPGSKAVFDLSFPSAQTPEPSSLFLLATGLCAIGCAIRTRRIA